MGKYKPYAAELLLVVATMIVGLLGFWTIYVGPDARPQPHHHLHVFTTYLWMALLLAQLILLARGSRSQHRRLGLAVLVAGPLLVGSAALLAVHSAHRAIVSGEPDILIVGNVLGTLWLALIVVLAFVFKKRRKVHGALLMSTLIQFLGPAIFFALIAWAPPFRIEGPETFYRFQTAGMTGLAIIMVTVLVMFLKDRRNNWPYLLSVSSYLIGEGVKPLLAALGLTDPLTRLVAAPHPIATFAVGFAILVALLATTALPRTKRPIAVDQQREATVP